MSRLAEAVVHRDEKQESDMERRMETSELTIDDLEDASGGISITLTFTTNMGKAGIAWNAAQGGSYTGAIEAATWLLFY